MKKKKVTAGELSKKAFADTTKYDALEVGHGMAEDIEKHLYESVKIYEKMIDEDEFCVVMVIAKDPLIKNLIRRKFYCWPYLPKPRPNQAVFLYSKIDGKITKRLWVLPCDMVMAEISSLAVVHKRYQKMQAWSIAFFEGKFWEYIRWEHNINMPSEQEYFLSNRQKLIESGCQVTDVPVRQPFDFSKIQPKEIVDSDNSLVS